MGGLQGLRRAANPADRELETGDIWTVVDVARARYGAVTAIPAADFVPAIAACALPRRRRR